MHRTRCWIWLSIMATCVGVCHAALELTPEALPVEQPVRATPQQPTEIPARWESTLTNTERNVQATTNVELRVRVELSDGSILIGRPVLSEFSLQTSFATVKLPLTMLDAVEFTKGSETNRVKMRNGDVLQGRLSARSLPLDTCVGRVELPLEHITRLRVMTTSDHDEVRFRAFIDGADEVHIRGDKLWYVHHSWKKPGQGDESTEKTFVNGQAWLPAWKGKVSDKFGPLDTPLPAQGSYRVALEGIKARGEVKLLQEPTEANGFEAVVRLDDSSVPAQDWYEFTLRWQP